jgi:hypothetical protein
VRPTLANIIKTMPAEQERVLKACYDNLITFGKFFLAGDFKKSETPFFHYEIAEELLSPSQKPCAIVISRGHAKTTLVKAKIVHDLCFAHKAYEWGFADKEKDLFFGWVSSNQKKSRNNVAYVRLHLEHNEKINYYFGKEDIGSLRGDSWNQEDLVTAYGDRLVSSSNLTSMRGDTLATIKSGAVRYSCVFIDDAENEENTRTQLSREKIVDNIMNGILPAIEKNEEGCRLFLCETPVHYDAFAQNIMDKWTLVQKEGQEAIDKYTWKVITYGVTQPEMPGGVLWKSWLPRKKLDEIKQTYADSPRGVEGYYQEYELQVQSSENALWSRKHLRFYEGYYYYEDGQNYVIINNEKYPVNTFIGCDPATDIETKHSDFSVILVIAVDMANNIYVLDYERHRSIPTLSLRDEKGEIDGKKGVVDIITELYDTYHCKSAVVEDVAMTRSVWQSLNAWQKKNNRYDVSFVPEPPGGREKINKIYTGLNARFASASIYVKENHYELINEIVKFGAKMAHDDTIESLYFACRYAFPPNFTGEREIETGKHIKKKRKAKPWIVA